MNPNPDIVRLENAMAECDLFALRRLVAQGVNPNAVVGTKFTALTSAVCLGKHELVEALLNVGADPNLRDMLGELPLSWACRDGDRDMCEILVAAGADPFQTNSEGRTAYWIANREQQYELFDWLCQYAARSRPEADVANAVLCLAALHGRPAGMAHLLNAGISVNGRDPDGATALHHAARAAHAACVELLLERGATVESRDNDGLTPLHYACMEDAREVAELLIARGASVNSKDDFGNTPLHVCVIDRSRNCARILLGHGASPTVRRSDDATPMDLVFGNWQAWLTGN